MEAIRDLSNRLDSIFSEEGSELSQALQFTEYVKSSNVKEFGDVEIAFRQKMQTLLKTESKMEVIIRLLKISLQVASQDYDDIPTLIPIAKMPYMLIEDWLEPQTVTEAERIWDVIESLTDELTHPKLFEKGKLTILRICNALLKRLSKSCDTEFCGRILMFLSSIYPISERSALNLGGKINSGNVTEFEDETVYLEARMMPGTKLSTSTSTTTIAVSASTGSIQSMDVVVGADATAIQETTTNTTTASTASASTTEDGEEVVENKELKEEYLQYKLFWEVQSFLSADTKKLEADFGITDICSATSTSSLPTPSATAKNAKWVDFLAHVNSLLSTLESHPYSQSELAQGREMLEKELTQCIQHQKSMRDSHPGNNVVNAMFKQSHHGASNNSDNSNSDEYMGCKYLTSSQLFSLQLRDPSVRMQILTQILIFCQHFIHRLTKLGNDVEHAPSKPAAVVSIATNKNSIRVDRTNRASSSSSSSTTAAAAAVSASSSSATSAASLIHAQIASLCAYYNDLRKIQTKVYSSLAVTPPMGVELVKSLKKILLRESRWIDWKLANCPSFQRKALSEEEFTTLFKGPPAKSTFGGGRSKNNKTAVDVTQAELAFTSDLSSEGVAEISKKLVAEVPTLDAHIELFLEAENPDNGIEAEYHPKHDGVYCWRARRLLAERNLSCFEKMQDGDITTAIRDLYNLGPVPVPVPVPLEEDNMFPMEVNTPIEPIEPIVETKGSVTSPADDVVADVVPSVQDENSEATELVVENENEEQVSKRAKIE